MATPSETKSSIRNYSALLAISTMLLVTFALSGNAATTDEDAKTILKRMSDYMAAQQTMELTFDSAIEVITPQLEKIQFTNSGQRGQIAGCAGGRTWSRPAGR